MFEIREKPEMVERAMLVSIYFDPSEAEEKQAMLDELEDLVSNLGIGIVGKHLVKSRTCTPNSCAARGRPRR